MIERGVAGEVGDRGHVQVHSNVGCGPRHWLPLLDGLFFPPIYAVHQQPTQLNLFEVVWHRYDGRGRETTKAA